MQTTAANFIEKWLIEFKLCSDGRNRRVKSEMNRSHHNDEGNMKSFIFYLFLFFVIIIKEKGSWSGREKSMSSQKNGEKEREREREKWRENNNKPRPLTWNNNWFGNNGRSPPRGEEPSHTHTHTLTQMNQMNLKLERQKLLEEIYHLIASAVRVATGTWSDWAHLHGISGISGIPVSQWDDWEEGEGVGGGGGGCQETSCWCGGGVPVGHCLAYIDNGRIELNTRAAIMPPYPLGCKSITSTCISSTSMSPRLIQLRWQLEEEEEGVCQSSR